jgi:hypothetical protein
MVFTQVPPDRLHAAGGEAHCPKRPPSKRPWLVEALHQRVSREQVDDRFVVQREVEGGFERVGSADHGAGGARRTENRFSHGGPPW